MTLREALDVLQAQGYTMRRIGGDDDARALIIDRDAEVIDVYTWGPDTGYMPGALVATGTRRLIRRDRVEVDEDGIRWGVTEWVPV